MQQDEQRGPGPSAEPGLVPPPVPGREGPGMGGTEWGEFRPLDPRVVSLWRLHSAIGSLVLLGAALAGGVIVAVRYRPALEWVGAGWLLLALVRTVYVFWYPPQAYRAWAYRVDARVLEARHGIWFRVLTLLPLSRLQHVDLNRGPLERMLGLASLTLYTAGSQASTVDIPGLDEAEAMRLRDHLLTLGGDDGV